MCNIPIYFCNIDIKHLEHTSETLETYAFSAMSPCCSNKRRLVVMELDASVVIDDGAEVRRGQLVGRWRAATVGGASSGRTAGGVRRSHIARHVELRPIWMCPR